jgi:hypothetical protein
MTEPKQYDVSVDSKILAIEPQDQDLAAAVASGGAHLVRADLPRLTVRVTASSESEAEARAVAALERWASGPGAGWKVVGTTEWKP